MTWQPKSSLTVETSHWTSSNMDSVSLLSSLQATDLDLQMKCKMYWKEDFGALSNSPVLFLLSPGKMLLTMFLFRSGLVALFLKMSERGDSWCTDSSFSSLLVKLSQVFESALLDSILKLAFIPVAWAHFPTNFFLPVTLHLICFDTALLEQPPLSVMTLCDLSSLWRVSMIVFWTFAKSAVFPIIVLSRDKEIPRMYTVWMVIYWNSNVNILIFWDTDFLNSLAVSSSKLKQKNFWSLLYM